MRLKFLVAIACAAALAVSSVALASGLTVKTTPTRASVGKTIQMLIKGLKPGERVKGKEYAPYGQTRTVFAPRPANAGGALVFEVKAQVRGKHRWVFTGRSSKRTGSTTYYVR